MSWDCMPKATRLADPICVFQSPASSGHRGQSWSSWKSQTPRWVPSHSFKVALEDAQAGEGVFIVLNVSPSAQGGLTSEASAEPGQGHAENQQEGPQQKRRRTSDLQDKGTHLLQGQTGPRYVLGASPRHLVHSIGGPAKAPSLLSKGLCET